MNSDSVSEINYLVIYNNNYQELKQAWFLLCDNFRVFILYEKITFDCVIEMSVKTSAGDCWNSYFHLASGNYKTNGRSDAGRGIPQNVGNLHYLQWDQRSPPPSTQPASKGSLSF